MLEDIPFFTIHWVSYRLEKMKLDLSILYRFSIYIFWYWPIPGIFYGMIWEFKHENSWMNKKWRWIYN